MFLNSNNDEKQNPQQNLQTNYPNDDYLYNKITSLQTKDKLKIYICAITVNTNLETHFVKYIVQHNNSNVSLPFFIFESQSNLPFEQPNQMLGQQQPNQMLGQQQPNLPFEQPNQMLGQQQQNLPLEQPKQIIG